MQVMVEIAGEEIPVEFTARITARAYPGRAASLDHPGEPPEAMEFEVELLGLGEASNNNLPTPDWLREIIEQHLLERDDVYEMVRDSEGDSE